MEMKMKKHPWQFLRIINDRLEIIPLGAGANLTIECPHPWTPDLWIDFLNADPEKPRSLWPVYKEFARAMEDLRDGIDEAGIQYNDEISDMKLLSREGFLAKYGSLREDAKELHDGMKEAVDKSKTDMIIALGQDSKARKSILRGAKIPSWITTVRITNLMAAATHTIDDTMAAATHTIDDTEIHLTLTEADADNFWLSNIVSGLVSSYTAGKVGRLCAAPDCDQFFIPSPHRPDQKYHSTRCQNRTFMRKARSAQQ